ncbi:MAG: SCP-like extracellular [Deltaproteobacteria bacterium]|nr:SCP-like extracellular [Deltaproteobacteria bacterium]
MILVVAVIIGHLSVADDQTAAAADSAVTEILKAHNRYRAELNIPPLTWSDRLAKNAQVWADRLATEKRMYHSSGTGEGENLWMGSAGEYSMTRMVDAWGREKRFYKDGIFPNVSTSGNWSDVGHYTQMIWRGTTEVGCAKSTGGGFDYLVCRYAPPGNVRGEKVY